MSVRLFVGNLAYDVTEAELKELFAPAGQVLQVRIPTDRETGRPKGIAFIDFADRAQADEAIRRFHQTLFKARPLMVNDARARDEKPPPRAERPEGGPSRPTWTGGLPSAAPPEEGERPGQPRRRFGPDAKQGAKKKLDYKSKGEKAPKIPAPKRAGGGGKRLFEMDEDEEDTGVDDFTLWAKGAGDDTDAE
jgi:RNA recognition motif-containing protein